MKIVHLNRMNCDSSQLEKNSQKKSRFFFFVVAVVVLWKINNHMKKTWHEEKQLMPHFIVEVFPQARGNGMWTIHRFSNIKQTFKYKIHFERVVFTRMKPNKHSDLSLGFEGLNEIIYVLYLTKKYVREQRRHQGSFAVNWYQKENGFLKV